MADPLTPPDPGPTVCPWCSAAVTPETAVCPSCLAILRSDEEHDLPGVTSVDAASLLTRRPPQRSKLLSWLGGDEVEPPATITEVDAIARPDEDVQREILRLELEAKISNLQAEADSILSDALVEGRVAELPDGLRPLVEAEAAAETPAETADALVAAAMSAQPESEDRDGSDPPVAEPDTDKPAS
ncbi:MAG: hypothetical protein ACJ769_11520 [Chloroflexota bacterium]